MSAEAEPARVDVSLGGGVTIEWRDGHISRYSIAALRAACPCATCQDLHGEGQSPTRMPEPPPANVLPLYKPTGATLTAVKPVGRYALNFIFSDGHSTGIFTWEYLRGLCRCEACSAGGRERPRPQPNEGRR